MLDLNDEWVQCAERECLVEMIDGSKVLRENVGLK